ncbi:MAG: hypothetical protein Q4E11_08095 [Corynebacterium sp.]|uniref:hypothetical protein n=1 Tax=Corynebacterium sp. TaxID=1720 RepID=UPI0026DD547C|nr:hypothetical protein [Corynebacterium sp.]MDO5030526.1 hypothetical protein [Corynebacterium sp.]
MEPMEVNAGRFYCRPLRHDSRVDDAPVATELLKELAPDSTNSPSSVAEFLTDSTADWENDTAYRFAVAEQTNVEMLALATVTPTGDDSVSIEVRPVGNPSRVLPNDDQVLTKVTVADGVEAAEKALHRWAEGFLGKKVD